MPTIAPGTRIGPYEVVSPIGAGGMGEVWRARDTRLDRSVAIKVLPAEFAQNAQLKLRFEREAKAISQLNHPNICTLYDVGLAAEDRSAPPYLVMELLEGESLADRAARGPLPMPDVLKYGAQIAEALDKAHRAGIVHRDLKPGNIMITKSGAKLLDFGLAKTEAAVAGGDGATQHKPLTTEGTILGTFQYMAPEQLEGEEADARTDIFALGAVLYEMSTGKRAFAGKTRTSLIASIVSGQPQPIRDLQPLTPPAFEHVVQRCLEKNRDDRWQSAADVAEELRWATTSNGFAVQRQPSARIPWIVAAILAAAAGTAAYFATRPQPPRSQYQFEIPMIGNGYSNGNDVRLADDGKTMFFRAVTPDGQRPIFRRALNDLTATPIEGTENSFAYAVSPDGRTILLSQSAGVIKRLSGSGGPLETIAQMKAGGFFAAAIAPDGTILMSGEGPISLVHPGGVLEPVTTVDRNRGDVAHEYPVFLPDGKHFLFIARSHDAAHGTVHRTLCASQLGATHITRVGEVTSRVEYAVGHVFYVRDGTLMAQPFDRKRLAFAGEAIPVVRDVGFNARSGAAGFSVARDGTIATRVFGIAGRPTWVDATGKKLGTLGGITTAAGTFSLVPHSGYAVLSLVDFHAGVQSLWVRGLTRDTATRVTFSPASESSPVVTPDGNSVFFASDLQSPQPDIFQAPIDGSTPPKLVIAADNVQTPTDISRDGKYLLYTTNENFGTMRQDIYVLPLTPGGKPHPFMATPAVENHGMFSPDGKWVVYWSNATGQGQIYVKPFPGPGAARLVSTIGGASPLFSPDGRRIYFARLDTLFKADFAADGTVSEPVPMFALPGEYIVSYAFAPAGDRFLMILQNDAEASPPVRVITGWQPPA